MKNHTHKRNGSFVKSTIPCYSYNRLETRSPLGLHPCNWIPFSLLVRGLVFTRRSCAALTSRITISLFEASIVQQHSFKKLPPLLVLPPNLNFGKLRWNCPRDVSSYLFSVLRSREEAWREHPCPSVEIQRMISTLDLGWKFVPFFQVAWRTFAYVQVILRERTRGNVTYLPLVKRRWFLKVVRAKISADNCFRIGSLAESSRRRFCDFISIMLELSARFIIHGW